MQNRKPVFISLSALAFASFALSDVASASMATLTSVAVASAPRTSGHGKAGRKIARQRDFKGVNKRSNGHRGNSHHNGKGNHRAAKGAHRNAEHARAIHHDAPRHHVNRHHGDSHHGGTHVSLGLHLGDSVHLGLGHSSHRRHDSHGHGHHRGITYGYGYSYGYPYGYSSYGYTPYGYNGYSNYGYDYGYRSSHDYGYGYNHAYTYDHDDDAYSNDTYVTHREPYRRSYSSPSVVIIDKSEHNNTYARSQPNTTGDAWSYFDTGDYAGAQSAFTRQAQAYPDAAGPKVGYALAAALRGDTSTAAWAFRRALRIDPEGVRRVPVSRALRERLESLMYRSRDEAESAHGDHAADAWLLLASVSYLLGDDQAASQAIHAVTAAGAYDVAAENLKKLADHTYNQR